MSTIRMSENYCTAGIEQTGGKQREERGGGGGNLIMRQADVFESVGFAIDRKPFPGVCRPML